MVKKSFFGFTLIEFIAVLAIAAIFITLVVPAYRAIIQNNKVVSAVNKLSASLSLARMEAIKRGEPVAVCPTANTNYSACGTGSQWSQGWIVFLDEDSDDEIDSTSDLIKITQGFSSDAEITTVSTVVSYDSNGFVTSGGASFVISAPGCTGNNGRQVNITSSGRISINAAACN